PVLVAVRRAAGGIHRCAGDRVRAAIDPVEHLVAVGIGGTAIRIDRRTSGRIGAPIDAVPDAVMVGIDRTAVAIDLGAGRCCRALVGQILYAAAIRTPGAGGRRRAAVGVHRRAGGGVGTLIDPVEHLVAVL